MSTAVLAAAAAAVFLTWACADGWSAARAHRTTGGRLERAAMAARRVVPGLVTHERLRNRATAAGLQRIGEDLLALKCGLALAVAIVTVPVVSALGPRAGGLLLVVAVVGTFFAPDAVLSRRIAARRQRIAIELPALLDLLAVTVGAGLPVASALREVAARQGGLLGLELRAAERSIEVGGSRSGALAAFSDRCPHEGVAAMVNAIASADRHGARLGPALASIASDARQQRARAIREHAAKAAPQIQLVIALGLVPATMLIVAAVLLSSF